ncbi:MAG: hypothetical protein HUU47_09290 [Bacteroidetes bacterium]|nr:hypothetical protein [Bacteroidota bacterium]
MEFSVNKFDKFWLGLTVGLFTPAFFVFIMFLQEKMFAMMLVSSLLRIGLVFNLVIFLITFYTKFTNIPKGILYATIFYALIIAYLFVTS